VHDRRPDTENVSSGGFASRHHPVQTSVAVLSASFLVLGFINWLWFFRDAMHARGLLVACLALSGVVGICAGLVVGIVWRLLPPAFLRGRPRPLPHALLWALIGPAFLFVSLKGLAQLRNIVPGRLLNLACLLAVAALCEVVCVIAGRLLDNLLERMAHRHAGFMTRLGGFASGIALAAAAALLLGIAGPTIWSRMSPGAAPQAAAVNPTAPNIILVSLDTLRPDHLSALGYPRPTSPHIDDVIHGGVLFEQTVASSSWTVLSHATLMTGASPSRIGPAMLEPATTGALRLPPQARTLAEILRDHGYQTAGFIGGATMRSTFGFDQGFDVFDDMLPPSLQASADFMFLAPELRSLLEIKRADFLRRLDPLFISTCNLLYGQGHQPPLDSFLRYSSYPRRSWNSADEVNAKVDAYLKRRSSAPQFLFVHYFDVHSPYDAPAPYFGRWGNDGKGLGYVQSNGLIKQVMQDGRVLTAAEIQTLIGSYDEEIASMDAGFGELMGRLRASGLLDHAIVVLFSDHGESFAEHQDLFHGHSLEETLIRILFAVQLTGGIEPGLRIGTQVRAVDILPTILDLAGIAVAATGDAPGIEGVSLVPMIRSKGGAEEPGAAFSELYGRGFRGPDFGQFSLDHHSIRSGGWKFVRRSDGVSWLYHLAEDPGEKHDLLAERPDIARDLAARLDAWRAKGFQKGKDEEVDPRRLEELKGLGYIDSN
jgi:arylsulfatase A-like enzyme